MSHIATPLLVEFLAAVSSAEDAAQAVRIATERAAQSLEAEVGVVVLGGRLSSVLGFPAGAAPEIELEEAAAGVREVLEVPGVGECHVTVAQIASEPGGQLVLARAGEGAFTVEETHLVRGMARMLGLALDSLRVLAQERSLRASLEERQRLLEDISGIQRAVAAREPLVDILKMLISSVRGMFLEEDLVTLHILAPYRHDLDQDAVASFVDRPGLRREPGALSDPGPPSSNGLDAAMHNAISAPVLENGVPAGSLRVVSPASKRVFAPAEMSMLRAFADVVSLAVSSARTIAQFEEAVHDALTGLASRRLFLERVEFSLSRTAGTGQTVAVLFMDLDRFKLVNDRLGHAAGDALLVQVAGRLRDTMRAGDVAARFGGDEFAVLLTEVASPQLPVAFAERIRDALSMPFVVGGTEVVVDASIGIALAAADTTDPEDLMRDADLAMYVAKRRGGGVQVFSASLASSARPHDDRRADLSRAIENDEMRLLYRPLIDLSTGAVAGAEALLRWQHPERGLIERAEFIQLAEETGLIIPIGRWVLREACRHASRWRDATPLAPPPFLSVNVSARQLQDRRLLQDVVDALAAAPLSPELLTLEITETLLLQEFEPAIASLLLLRERGIQIAMDDFGTGYSSLTNLRRLPVDILKVDRSFVADAATDAGASLLARSIVSFAHGLGLLAVAEGIENADQAAALCRAGCDLGQGFHFAPPLDGDAFQEWLRANAAEPLRRTMPPSKVAVEYGHLLGAEDSRVRTH